MNRSDLGRHVHASPPRSAEVAGSCDTLVTPRPAATMCCRSMTASRRGCPVTRYGVVLSVGGVGGGAGGGCPVRRYGVVCQWGVGRGRGAVLDAEFGENRADVVAYGLGADAKDRGD